MNKALHLAIWADDPDRLNRLIESKTLDINKLDGKGNSPMHLALKLRRTKCLYVLLKHIRESGLRLNIRDREGWTPIMNARSCLKYPNEEHRKFFTELLLERRLQGLLAFQARIPELVKIMKTSIPDFEMKLKFKFSSLIPFLSSVLPKDTIVIRKRGVRLRIDMTLVDFEGLRWKRGKLSFIFEGDCKEEPGRLRVLDNEAKTEGDALHSLKRPTEDKIKEMVDRMLLSKVVTVAGLNFREIRFKPVKKASKVARFFGASSETILEEDVGGWVGTKVYKISDLKLKIKTRPRPLADRSMIGEFLSKQLAQARSRSSVSSPGNSTDFPISDDEDENIDNEKRDEDTNETGGCDSTQATVSAIKALVKAGEATLGSPTNVSPSTPKSRGRFSSTADSPDSVPDVITRQKNDYMIVSVPRRDEITIPIHLCEGDVLKWSFATSSHNIDFDVKFLSLDSKDWFEIVEKSRVESQKSLQKGSYVASKSAGTLALTFGNSFSRFRSKSVYYRVQIHRKGEKRMKTLHCEVPFDGEMETFLNYFGSRANDLDKTCPACDFMFPKGEATKEVQREFTSKLWMSEKFPLSVKHITPIIEVLAQTSRHLESLKEFFDSNMPRGFPVKFELPVLPLVAAQVTFVSCTIKENPKELFEVPEDYDLGAYIPHSVRSKMKRTGSRTPSPKRDILRTRHFEAEEDAEEEDFGDFDDCDDGGED